MNNKEKLTKSIRLISWLVVVVSLYFSLKYLLRGDIVFHSDIARDMVLMDNAVKNRRPFLIGEGIRGIPGLYHGPAWLYLNLPAFILGGGNPVVVGWGWILLVLAYLGSIFYVGKKIFGKTVAVVATALIATRIPIISHQLMNPNGAFFLFPIFFYFGWLYYNKHNRKDLSLAVIIAGFMIQFEIMFGLPMAIGLIVLTGWLIFKRKVKWFDLFSFGLIAIPLSTYIAFDVRHNFAQIKTFVSYLRNPGERFFSMSDILQNRFREMTMSLGVLSRGPSWIYILLSIALYLSLVLGLLRSKTKEKRSFYSLYILFSLVFWLFSLLFPEPIKGYYYDFSVLNIFILISQLLVNRLGMVVFLLPIMYLNLTQAKTTAFSTYDFTGNKESSWVYNYKLGQEIMKTAPDEFSVFTLDTDIWGYSARYGITYAAKRDGKRVDFANKSNVTYLVIAKNTINHPRFDVRWWKEDQVAIKGNPSENWEYKDHFIIEKYVLSDEEVSIPEDPDLMSTSLKLR